MELVSRASYRGQVTKLVNAASDYLKSDESKINENLNNLESIEEELSVMLDRLTAAYECLKKANKEVSSFIKQEDWSKEADLVAEYEDKAMSAITRLKFRLAKIRKIQNPLSFAENLPEPTLANSTVHNLSAHGAVKLQRLQPKKFSGDFKEWVPFWEQYRVLVHENAALTTIDKFNYLENALTGKAMETLVGLTPTEANYNAAIELLKEEYGNNEKIVDYTMQRLLSIQPVGSKADVVGLRRLYTSVLASTRSLSSLGIPSSNYFVMLKGVLLRCLPNELRVDFHRYYDDTAENNHDSEDDTASTVSQNPSSNIVGDKQVKCLLKFLKREVDSLEKANEGKLVTSRSQVHNNQRPVKTALGLFAADVVKENCVFCQGANHYSRDCYSKKKSLTEKKEVLKNEGRCFRCCKKGHNSRVCKAKGVLCKTCSGRHATSMCDPSYMQSKGVSTSVNEGQSEEMMSNNASTSQSSLNLYTSDTMPPGNVYLQTACAYACSEFSSSHLYVRLVMDGGSQLTFVKTSLARRLNLPIVGEHCLSVIPFGSIMPNPSTSCNKVRLVLRSQYDDQAVVLDAIEVPEICVDVLSVPTNDTAIALNNFTLADARTHGLRLEEGISILIGADTYWQFATGEYKRLTEKLTAINTILGWTIQGPSIGRSSNPTAEVATTLSLCACEDIQRFWKLDLLGIAQDSDKNVSSTLSLNIRRVGQRYEASLPWRSTSTPLNDNRTGALVRLQSLIRKLCSSKRMTEYSIAMNEMVSEGIAEVVAETGTSENRVYYLPHRPVYREDKKTSKLRIVFDASAHAPNHLSLNECLEVGENLLPDLLAILLNFRIKKVGLIADIEKAFLQISLHPADRDSHRFLWLSEKIASENHLPAVQTYRMTRVTFGVTCSPYLLCATLRSIINEVSSKYKRTSELLLRSFYMDDLILSVDDEETAKIIYQEANIILRSASMTLRKWNSNSSAVRGYFSTEGESDSIQKVLGLRWIIGTDELAVDLDSVSQLLKSNHLPNTKRSVLKITAKIFDPFGILCPWTVRWKILFQNIWRRRLEWDELLPQDLQKVWSACRNEVDELWEMAIPRHLGIVTGSTQIHIFADASQLAYGAVAYVRTTNNDGEVSTQIICAKNRVAPLKSDNQNELTLPKLELTAALIAARLLSYLRSKLHFTISDVFLWTDSQISLFWIKGTEKRWKPYVENRVREIRTLTDVLTWRHCPGADNPADLLTRGIAASSLIKSSTWLNGPTWLRGNEVDFPNSCPSNAILLCTAMCLAEGEPNNLTDENKFIGGEPILKEEDFSTWRRLLRVTAYTFRALDVFLHKRRAKTKYLSAEEIQRAEKYWILRTQRQHFPNDIAALRMNKGMSSTSKLLTLSPFIDEGNEYLRVGGRLQSVAKDVNDAHPIILPKTSHISKLIVLDFHERSFHAGPSAVLSRLRSLYWIIKGRQLIKGLTKNCFICKALRGKAYTQIFAPLPKDRILLSKPFEVTGMDFAGPLYIVDQAGQRVKMYILLFTCAAVRAVHIESTSDLTTESCLLAIRRFIARRGPPRIIYSDNAKTFKRASTELRQINNLKTNERFLGFLSDSRINWKFIVERAPWWGGFWERLIGVVKSALRSAIGRSTLNADQLNTLLVEVESVVNSRPLTYTGDDPLDLAPLTPSNFLNNANATAVDPSCEQNTGTGLRKQWKDRLRFLAAFKKRWYKEYLYQLRSLHHAKHTMGSRIKVGEVVLLEDRSLPRPLWHLAVVEKIFPGRDGNIRACEIRLSTGSILRRPIQLLYPLEITD